MPERRRLAVVPARNEEEAVGGVVVELRAFDPTLDVVVIDDGSSDATAERAVAAGAASVSNPYRGIERWFEPGQELLVVDSADAAVAAYRELLDDPGAAEELGRRARERALDEHTYAQRARRLLELVGLGEPAPVATRGSAA